MAMLKNVAVTGANRGLGLEMVKQLCSNTKCSRILATCRNPDKADQLLYLAKTHPAKLLVKSLDVNQIESFPDFVASLESSSEFTELSCLINNAGVAPKATRYNLVTVEQMENTIRTNLIAPLFLSKAFLPMLKRNSDGSLIVNMSSSLGSLEDNVKVMRHGGSGGGQYPYRTSKAGLNMITRSLSVDLESFNIGAISIHPGWVRTDMGGPRAHLSPDESVQGILSVISNYDSAKHNGHFLDYQGCDYPW